MVLDIAGALFNAYLYEGFNIPEASIKMGGIGSKNETIYEGQLVDGSYTTPEALTISSSKNYFYKISEIQTPNGYKNNLLGYSIIVPFNIKTGELEFGCRYSLNENDVYKPANHYIIINNTTKQMVPETDELYEKVSVGSYSNIIVVSVVNDKKPDGKYGEYNIGILKTDSNDDETKVENMQFNLTRTEKIEDNGNITTNDSVNMGKMTTNSEGYSESKAIPINGIGTDIIQITEVIDNNNNYIELKDPLNVYIKKEEINGAYEATKVSFEENSEVTTKEVTLSDNITKVIVKAEIDEKDEEDEKDEKTVKITIPNKKVEGSYDLQVIKTGETEDIKLQGVKFKAKDSEETLGENYVTNENGLVTIFSNKEITEDGIDYYEIEEVSVGENNYVKLNEPIRIFVEKELNDTKYKIKEVSFDINEDYSYTDDETSNTDDESSDTEINYDLENIKEITKVTHEKDIELENGDTVEAKLELNSDGTLITLTIENEPISGGYTLRIKKVENEWEYPISGVQFKVSKNNEEINMGSSKTSSTGLIQVGTTNAITASNVNTPDEFKVTEINLNNKPYVKLKENITLYVHKTLDGNNYKVSGVSFDANGEVKTSVTKSGVKLENDKTVDVEAYVSGNIVYLKIPNESISGKYNLELLKTKEDKQTPLSDVTFTVTRGLGENIETLVDKQTTGTDGKISVVTDEEINEDNLTTIDVYTITENATDSRYLKMKSNIKVYVTKSKVENEYKATKVSFASDSDIQETEITLQDNTKLTAKAEIEDGTVRITIPNKEIKGNYGLEILKLGEDDKPLQGASFKAEEVEGESSKELTIANNTTGEDGKVTVFTDRNITSDNVKTQDVLKITEIATDDKYVPLPEALTIYVSKGTNTEGTDEEPTAYIAKSASFDSKTAVTTKNITLKNGKEVTVSLSVKDSLVTLTIPNRKIEGKYDLELIKIDQKDGVSVLPGVTFDITTKKGNEEVKLYDVDGKEINTKGLTTNEEGKIVIPNVKITEGASYNFEITETKVPDGYVMLKDKITLSFNTKVNTETQKYVLDAVKLSGVAEYEAESNKITVKVQNGQFDLALRKFISGVKVSAGTENEKTVQVPDRTPVFKVDENGNYIYEHSKDPVLVGNQNVVEYTLRVYNEGSISGYAKEIKDDIPEGLEFLPDDETNKKYGWKLLDEEGNEVKEVNKAKYIVTNYLSKENETEKGENLIKGFNTKDYADGKVTEPNYKEVKVAFKVTMPNTDDRIIINKAQISDDSDEDGNDVTDKDSTPDEWIDGEDDQDIEKIKVQYFDLALRKWVTKAIVIEDGKETVTETGHKAEDDPEDIVKVDLKESKINNVVVKFEYKIRITNEGEIAGYAKEISDYIPEGLKFDAADNPTWKEVEGKIVTTELENTLLNPGETAEVSVILTWINRKDNMGLKQNVAEISKDYNIYGTPDIDSTPNNQIPGEDDIDDAPVMLTVKTGQAVTYVGLAIAVLAMLGSGVVLIKKYVLK